MNVFAKFRHTLEQKPYILAAVISISLIGWMFSGPSHSDELKAKAAAEQAENGIEKVAKVEVTKIAPETTTRTIEVYGRTEPDRSLALSSQIEGRVDAIRVEDGQFVKKGQVIVVLDVEDKKAQLKQAKALVSQREIEYEAAQKLRSKRLQGESQVAQAKAALESATAAVKQKQIMLAKSVIKAPFAGVINDRKIEVGTFVRKGDPLFQLVDLNPLVVKADLTERHIDSLTVNNSVKVTLANGQTVDGKIQYISSVSTLGTNTFPMEVAVNNPQQKMKAGVSTSMAIAFKPELAIMSVVATP